MSWLTILATVVSLVNKFATWLSNNQLIEAGKAMEALANIGEADEKLQKALAARAAVRSDIERNPDSLHSDDGFKRPD